MPYAPPEQGLNQALVEVSELLASKSPPSRHVLVATPSLRVVLLALPAGQETPLHVHPYADEVFHVLRGHADFLIGGKRLAARGTGAVLLAPRNTAHQIRVSERGPALVMCVVAPNEDRDDEELDVEVAHP